MILGERYSRLHEYHARLSPEVCSVRDGIIKNCVAGEKLMEVPCLCGLTRNDTVIASVDRFGFNANHMLCGNCGLIRISPRWREETYTKIYQSNYWTLERGGEKHPSTERFALSVERAADAANYIFRRLSIEDKKVLEIGCSYGAALTHFAGRAKYVCGYDLDPEVIEVGRKRTGLNLFVGGVSDIIKDENRPFDIIVMRHVFEHLLDPIKNVNEIIQLLSRDGKLFVELPGVMNPLDWLPDPVHYFQIFHVYSYCLSTLSNVMEQCGMEKHDGNERVYSLWNRSSVNSVPRWNNPDTAKTVRRFMLKMEIYRKCFSAFWGLPLRMVHPYIGAYYKNKWT